MSDAVLGVAWRGKEGLDRGLYLTMYLEYYYLIKRQAYEAPKSN